MNRLSYLQQTGLTVVIILLFNFLTSLCGHWIYSSIGFALCGFLWIWHPVMAGKKKPTETQLNIIRLSGVVFLVMAVFSRSYLY